MLQSRISKIMSLDEVFMETYGIIKVCRFSYYDKIILLQFKIRSLFLLKKNTLISIQM